MDKVFLLIGGNMGGRLDYLNKAIKLIEFKAGDLIEKSSVYETAAWGNEDQPAFLNQVLLINTKLLPLPLLKILLEIEEDLGRKRMNKYDPRTMDIDILFYNNEVINHPNLKVPHPAIQDRRFVLEPLFEVAANFVHPTLKKTIAELLIDCKDQLEVKKLAVE